MSENGEAVCRWLCKFFTEVIKGDGLEYCPRSLSCLLGGLHRYVESHSPHGLKLNTGDEFKPLHTLLDNLFRELHAKGIGAAKCQAAPITDEEESKLWESGVLGSSNPDALLKSVFFYNGLNFTLRGGEEHRSLSLSQIKFGEEDNTEYMEYTENSSKNRPGGNKQLNLENKVVCFYSQPSLGECCHVLLKLYISKLLEESVKKDLFYCRPLKKFSDDGPWYCNMSLGHNTLNSKLKTMLQMAGLTTERKSIHSLRATSISRMFQANVPEKIIMERSGHLTKEGVRSYERTTNDQTKEVCDELVSNVPEPDGKNKDKGMYIL